MNRYELLEKGQTNIKLTTNAVVTGDDTLVVYKIVDNAGSVSITDITEASPTISDIANGKFKRYNLTAPNEDCYILAIINDQPQFMRVGNPPIRIFMYSGVTSETINYELLNFDGTLAKQGSMTEVGFGVYFAQPDDVGDYIFTSDKHKPIPVHTPYVTDSVGMSGKIVFQKDQWMLLAVPKDGAKISDLVASVEAKYGVAGNTIFRVFSAYPATNDQGLEMLDYKPGVTPLNTKYNFSLVYADGSAKEITGFWCKTENYTVNGDADELVVYEWNA
jgi:hypothetical protein